MFLFLSASTFVLSFFRPTWGFAIFLLANSGGLGFFSHLGLLGPELGPLRPENMAVIGATASLLWRSFFRVKASTHIDWIGVWLLLLTGIMFVSRVVELGPEDLWNIVKFGLSCMFVGPLYLAFKELSPREHLTLRWLIISAAVLSALLTVIVVVSGNAMLYKSLIATQAGTDISMPKDLVSARVTLPGIWTLVPLGFWLTLRELLDSKALFSSRTLFYGLGACLMLISIFLNLSRSMLLALVTGLIAISILQFRLIEKNRNKKIVTVLAFSIISVAVGYYGFQGLYGKWAERLGEGTQAESWLLRVNKSSDMASILVKEIPVLGHMNDERDKVIRGDPYPFFRLWWDYGLLAPISFFAALITVFCCLVRNLQRYRQMPPETIKTTICLTAFFLDFQWQLLSGFYLTRDALFPLIFYFSEVFLITTPVVIRGTLEAWNPRPGLTLPGQISRLSRGRVINASRPPRT